MVIYSKNELEEDRLRPYQNFNLGSMRIVFNFKGMDILSTQLSEGSTKKLLGLCVPGGVPRPEHTNPVTTFEYTSF